MAQLTIKTDVPSVVKRLVSLIEESANAAIARDDVFKVGLSGGSLVEFLSDGLPCISTEWRKWRFSFCDERVVEFDNVESTYGIYKSNLTGKLPITGDQCIKINPNPSGKCIEQVPGPGSIQPPHANSK